MGIFCRYIINGVLSLPDDKCKKRIVGLLNINVGCVCLSAFGEDGETGH